MSDATIHRWLAWGLVATAAVTFVALLRITAPYGRHGRSGWGRSISTRHAWLIMESPACVGFAAVYALGPARADLAPLTLLALWQTHYVYRAFVYPFRIRSEGKTTPLVIAAMGCAFNLLNAYLNARQISALGSYGDSWLGDPRFLGGFVVFFAGREINLRSDAILLGLRTEDKEYRVPRGGLFRWVSCPNYLGEVVQWCGWALATWSLAGAAFALYTFANLAPRALAHHRWYREKFSRYPAERRALIPFLL